MVGWTVELKRGVCYRKEVRGLYIKSLGRLYIPGPIDNGSINNISTIPWPIIDFVFDTQLKVIPQ